jgi:hypothetical protein
VALHTVLLLGRIPAKGNENQALPLSGPFLPTHEPLWLRLATIQDWKTWVGRGGYDRGQRHVQKTPQMGRLLAFSPRRVGSFPADRHEDGRPDSTS